MTSAMDMALDDVIAKNKTERRGGRGGRGGRGTRRRGGYSNQHDDRTTTEKEDVEMNLGTGYRKNGGQGGGAFRRERINKRNVKPYGGNDENKEAMLNDNTTVWGHDLFEKVQAGKEPTISFPSSEKNFSLETGTKVLVENLDFGVAEEDLKDLFESIGTIKRATIRYDRSGRSIGTGEVVFAKKSDADAAIKKYDGVPLDGKPMKISLVGSNLAPRGGFIIHSNNVSSRRNVVRGKRGGRGSSRR